MEKWNDILTGVAKNAGARGLKELEDAINGVSDLSKESWQRAVISLVQDAIAKDGLDGLKNVTQIVKDAIDGKGVNIEFASLKTQSDFLAAMQNMEADGKKKAMELLQRIGQFIASIVKAILSGIK